MPVPFSQLLKCFISLLLCLLTGFLFFPGSYSVDTWSQYQQMASGQYNDWFGPAMPFTWRVLWLITGKIQSIYVVQMFLYWLFITLLVWDMKVISLRYWITIIAAVFFTFIPQYIMRDSLMVLCWGIAALLLIKIQDSKYFKTWAVAAALLLFYGLWLRTNALMGLIPLIYILIVSLDTTAIIGKFRLILSIGACALLLLFTQALTYNILHTSKAYPSYKLKLLDITGITKLSRQNYIPERIRDHETFNIDTLLQNYTAATFDNIYWPENGTKPIVPYPDEMLNSCVSDSWNVALHDHPLYYLRNRTSGFLYYLHLRKRFKNDEYWNVALWIDPNNPLNLQMKPDKNRDRFGHMYAKLNHTFFYDPWFWLLLNIVLCTLFFYRHRSTGSRYWQTHALIQLSGVIYILSQFPIYQHDRDFRYTYWNVIVVLIALGAFSKRNAYEIEEF